MGEASRDWMARTVISLVPVAVTPATIVFGNPPIEAAGEAIATFVYFLVVLSSENVVLFGSHERESSRITLAWEAMILTIAMGLWMFIVFVRVEAQVSPTGQALLLLLTVTALAILLGYYILRTHRELYGQDVAARIRMADERLEKRVEGRPEEVSLGGGKIGLK